MELLGILLPILIDLVVRRVKDSDLRFWISVAICAVVGIGLNALHTGLHFAAPIDAFNSITTSIMATFGLAQLSYKAVWEDATARVKLFGLGIASNSDVLKKN